MDDLAQRVQTVKQQIQQAATAAGRQADEITLVAVSKTKPHPAIAVAYRAGITCFGENYLQEALAKQQQLAHLPIEWHFIGSIQSNKTKTIAENFAWVASVDKQKILERLSAQRPADSAPLQVLLQVNISSDENKSGINPDQALALADVCASLPRLQLRGLMAIPKQGTASELTSDFQAMKTLFDELTQAHPGVDTLSMGMSDDFALAIACGATQVRIGSLLFGERG